MQPPVVKRLTNLLATLAQGRAIVIAHDPLRLAPYSEPEPDLMLLKPRADFYSEAHPDAQDVLLLIEVCDTTVRYDREVKLPLYARHGVAEGWLIDLEERTVEICRTPQSEAGEYAERKAFSGGTLAPRALPDCRVVVGELFPRL